MNIYLTIRGFGLLNKAINLFISALLMHSLKAKQRLSDPCETHFESNTPIYKMLSFMQQLQSFLLRHYHFSADIDGENRLEIKCPLRHTNKLNLLKQSTNFIPISDSPNSNLKLRQPNYQTQLRHKTFFSLILIKNFQQ